MNMKPGASKKSIKPGNKALALFSRLNGLGVEGLTYQHAEQKEEKMIPAKENQSVSNKAANSISSCKNQKYCYEQFNCQPGKNHSCHASVDLWFYLSGQA
jgi:hypothetical protein